MMNSNGEKTHGKQKVKRRGYRESRKEYFIKKKKKPKKQLMSVRREEKADQEKKRKTGKGEVTE